MSAPHAGRSEAPETTMHASSSFSTGVQAASHGSAWSGAGARAARSVPRSPAARRAEATRAVLPAPGSPESTTERPASRSSASCCTADRQAAEVHGSAGPAARLGSTR